MSSTICRSDSRFSLITRCFSACSSSNWDSRLLIWKNNHIFRYIFPELSSLMPHDKRNSTVKSPNKEDEKKILFSDWMLSDLQVQLLDPLFLCAIEAFAFRNSFPIVLLTAHDKQDGNCDSELLISLLKILPNASRWSNWVYILKGWSGLSWLAIKPRAKKILYWLAEEVKFEI